MSTELGMRSSAEGFDPLLISSAEVNREQGLISATLVNTYYRQWSTLLKALNSGEISRNKRLLHLEELRESAYHLEQLTPVDSHQFLIAIDCLILLAQELCDWVLLIYIYETLIKKHTKNFTIINKALSSLPLLYAYYQMGRLDLAKKILEKELLLNPNNTQYYTYWQSLNHCDNSHSLGYLVDNDIVLTPLCEQHIDSFSWQYNHSIMTLCNLPNFTEDDEWYHWLADVTAMTSAYEHSLAFAIIHSDWGFIGAIHLKVVQGIGFFYYWLGEDFQGYGFGPRAVHLLLEYGYEVFDMSCCYAKVYSHNTPSHKAIKKIGFKALPFTAPAPDDNEVFYYFGAEKSNDQLFIELRNLVHYLDDFLTVIPNQCIALCE